MGPVGLREVCQKWPKPSKIVKFSDHIVSTTRTMGGTGRRNLKKKNVFFWCLDKKSSVSFFFLLIFPAYFGRAEGSPVVSTIYLNFLSGWRCARGSGIRKSTVARPITLSQARQAACRPRIREYTLIYWYYRTILYQGIQCNILLLWGTS